MKNFDIEAFLEHKMTEEELIAFEAELTENHAFAAEVAQQKQLKEDLETIALRKEIDAALSGHVVPPKNRAKSFKNIILFSGLLVVSLVIVFFLLQNEKPTMEKVDEVENPSSIQPEIETNSPAKNIENEPVEIPEKTIEKEEKKQANPPKQPIAQSENITPIAPPLYPSPNLRGAQGNNEEWQSFLDEIWYTDYPFPNLNLNSSFQKIDEHLRERNFSKAYVRLQRMERKIEQNDTLRLLKGYALMEMGEGKESQLNFENLEKKHPEWQAHLEWYRGLSLLLTGEKEAAKKVFLNISKQKNHAFQQQAEKGKLLIE